ncbi:hypothetical protein L7F22_044763 [Adiantum nelumboides]|nr:hypothetical protein [Adiantum nelumboides]
MAEIDCSETQLQQSQKHHAELTRAHVGKHDAINPYGVVAIPPPIKGCKSLFPASNRVNPLVNHKWTHQKTFNPSITTSQRQQSDCHLAPSTQRHELSQPHHDHSNNLLATSMQRPISLSTRIGPTLDRPQGSLLGNSCLLQDEAFGGMGLDKGNSKSGITMQPTSNSSVLSNNIGDQHMRNKCHQDCGNVDLRLSKEGAPLQMNHGTTSDSISNVVNGVAAHNPAIMGGPQLVAPLNYTLSLSDAKISSNWLSSGGSQDLTATEKEMIYHAAALQPINDLNPTCSITSIDGEVDKPKPRQNVRISKDPQSVAARQRRQRISSKMRVLQKLVPGGMKMDTASMLEEAAHYLKFLKAEVEKMEAFEQLMTMAKGHFDNKLAQATASHNNMLHGPQMSKRVYTLSPHHAMNAWKGCKDVSLALSLFEDISLLIQKANCGIKSNLANGEESNYNVKEASCMRSNIGAFNVALNACANACLVEKANEIFNGLNKLGLQPDILTFNNMIKLYALSNNKSKLFNVLYEMENTGVQPSLSMMHLLVATYVGLNELDRAFMIVEALREGKEDISKILSNNLALKMGQPDLAKKIFQEMDQDKRVKVNTIGWNVLINCYSRAGHADRAKKAF